MTEDGAPRLGLDDLLEPPVLTQDLPGDGGQVVVRAGKVKRATIKAVKAVKAAVIHWAAVKAVRAAASAVTAPPR